MVDLSARTLSSPGTWPSDRRLQLLHHLLFRVAARSDGAAYGPLGTGCLPQCIAVLPGIADSGRIQRLRRRLALPPLSSGATRSDPTARTPDYRHRRRAAPTPVGAVVVSGSGAVASSRLALS